MLGTVRTHTVDSTLLSYKGNFLAVANQEARTECSATTISPEDQKLLWRTLYQNDAFTLSDNSEFAERSPWIFGVLWGVLMVPGMVGSGIIGSRAGRRIAPGGAARSAGIRVFLYWLAVVVAIFLIPAAAGMWNAENGDNIPGVVLGIVSLGYILFGIMHRPVLAVVGVGFAAAFYIPNYLMDSDEVMLVSAGLMLVVVALGAWWIRKSEIH